jgi:hypothetical protein
MIVKLNSVNFENGLRIIFASALFLTSIIIHVPLELKMPSEGLDPSWAYAMNIVISQGWSIGEHVVFTFGPYAPVVTKTFHPDLYGMTMLASLYLAASFFLISHCVFKSSWIWVRIGFILTLWSVFYFPDTLFYIYFLMFYVYVGMNIANNRPLSWFDKLTFVLGSSCFGMIALIKGSLLIGCFLTISLSAYAICISSNYKRAVAVVLIPLFSLMFFWLAASQDFESLPNYFSSLIPIVLGYTEAMSSKGSLTEIYYYLASGFLIIVLLMLFSKGVIFIRFLLIIMFSLIIFLVFKSGFVRHDAHALIASSTLLLISILAASLIAKRASIILLFLSFFSWYSVSINYTYFASVNPFVIINDRYVSALRGLRTQLDDYSELEKKYLSAIKNLKNEGQLLDLKGTVDIYSYDQSYLIASGNIWNPRPIFQSYSAYTKSLLEKNRDHLLGENSPDNIIFKIQPIDGRLPSLEDGVSWPVLLAKYRPTKLLQESLYLERRVDAIIPQGEFTKRIDAGVYQIGESIQLPGKSDLLFATIKLKKSIGGKLVNTLFKPSQLEIKLVLDDDSVYSYRMISGMAESGFFISPLIRSVEEFGLLYSDVKNLSHLMVKSIRVDVLDNALMWADDFEINFFAVQYESSPNFFEVMNFSLPYASDFRRIKVSSSCFGSIDYANGVRNDDKIVAASSFLNIHGWLATDVNLPLIPENIHLIISDERGRRWFLDAVKSSRPDVGNHFQQPLLDLSGYKIFADVSGLKGNYSLTLAYSNGGDFFSCSQFNIPISIN